MFNISGPCDFNESFSELNIVPLAISYEYEPCCAVKVKELTSVVKGIPYQKEAHEDLMSIINGITQPKGHIHLAACTPVNQFLAETGEFANVNDKINKLASLIDSSIYSNYRLWPTNYMAYDLLHSSRKFALKYTADEFDKFNTYMNKELSIFTGNKSLQQELLLKIYANPVINAGISV